jgi:hypothetical protein
MLVPGAGFGDGGRGQSRGAQGGGAGFWNWVPDSRHTHTRTSAQDTLRYRPCSAVQRSAVQVS